MHISPARQPQTFARSSRQRDWEEDQDRWEAQLRRLAQVKQAEERRLPAGQRPVARTPLELATAFTRHDSLFLCRSSPEFSGSEREDLVCGKCGDTIGSHITPETIRSRHPEGDRLLIRCMCRALNLLTANGSRSR
jgi:hypothetical protein